MAITAVSKRFFAKVDVSTIDQCWLWTAHLNNKGYGEFSFNGKVALAHRVAYELFVEPIPEGLVIDHVRSRGCVSTACVNPAHLEPVTQRENMRRGAVATATHCSKGHPFNEANTYVRKSGRYCRACRLRSNREYQARKKTLYKEAS